MVSRNMMIAIIGIMAVISVGSLAAYYQERSKAPGVDIRIDKNGLQIEQR